MFKESVKDKIRGYVRANYQKINSWDMLLGEINYTHRCHLNAVQKVKEGKAEKVFSCIAIDRKSNWLCVHFINQTKEGKFVDHTWGWLKQDYSYYIIKEIDYDEMDSITNCLSQTKEFLVNLHTNWFQRLFVKPDLI